MKFKSILFVAVTLLITSCQSEKSKSKDKIDEPVIIEDNAEGKSLDNFVDELLDYRELNKSYNHFMIIDKPITISLPEIYENKDNIYIKNRFNTKLDKNSNTNEYRLTRNKNKPSKQMNFFG